MEGVGQEPPPELLAMARSGATKKRPAWMGRAGGGRGGGGGEARRGDGDSWGRHGGQDDYGSQDGYGGGHHGRSHGTFRTHDTQGGMAWGNSWWVVGVEGAGGGGRGGRGQGCSSPLMRVEGGQGCSSPLMRVEGGQGC